MITSEQFAACFPEVSAATRALVLPGIIDTFNRFGINTPKRMAAFLAQCGHESLSFRYRAENLNYTAAELLTTFPHSFTTPQALNYAHHPEMIANRVYAGKNGNGNEASGDGWAFAGKGWIQVTGKGQYVAFAAYMGITVAQAVALAGTYDGAALISGWYWSVAHNLNALADGGKFDTITKIVNAASLGKQDRANRYAKYLKILAT